MINFSIHIVKYSEIILPQKLMEGEMTQTWYAYMNKRKKRKNGFSSRTSIPLDYRGEINSSVQI
jgi:hypothetical protein